jgi:hypothetical protein
MIYQTDEQYLSDNDILDMILEKELQVVEALEDVYAGLINPLIMRGPPGTGKSEIIERTSRATGIVSTDLLSSEYEKPTKEESDAGAPAYPYKCTNLVTRLGALNRGADYNTWGLVADLFGNSKSGALCMDDNDSILEDSTAVAILMKATEQKAEREVTYAKASSTHELQMRGVPPVFKLTTPIIITTNIDMKTMVDVALMKEEASKSKNNKSAKPYVMPTKLKRWSALMDRGVYIDLGMNTPRSIRVYCEHKILKNDILTDSDYLNHNYGRSLTVAERDEVMGWVRSRQSKLSGPLTLRTYNQVASVFLRRPTSFDKSASARFLKAV